jgi:hypothetical protein
LITIFGFFAATAGAGVVDDKLLPVLEEEDVAFVLHTN